MVMVQKQLIKVVIGIALLVIGMVTIVLGIIIAAIAAEGNWLYVSAGGFAAIIIGIVLIISELHRAVRFVRQYTPDSVKRKVKYIKHD